MKVVLSGGEKTINIKTGVEKKFKSSGDEFIVEKYIEDIGSIFTRGDSFDRALITEQSLTKDGVITSEDEIRQRIGEFVEGVLRRDRKNESFVFLVQSEGMAELISDEVFNIRNSSAVVIKEPPYSVSFFVNLIVDDVEKIPDELLYHPPVVTGDTVEAADGFGGEQFSEDPFQSSSDTFDEQGVVPVDYTAEVGQVGLFDDSDLPLPSDGFEQIEDKSDNKEQESNSKQNSSQSVQIPGFDDADYESEDKAFSADGYGNDNVEQEFSVTMNQDAFGKAQNSQKGGTNFIDNTVSEIPGFDDSDYEDKYNGQQNLDGDINLGETDMMSGPAGSAVGMTIGSTINSAEGQFGGLDETEGQFNQVQADGQNELGGLNNANQANGMDTVGQGNAISYQQQMMQVGSGQRMPSRLAGGLTPDKVREALKPFAARGNTIVVTGCGGCGTSFIAHNLANMVCQLGYTALLVDMDTKGRAQSYISRGAYDNMEVDGANLMAAVNSSTGISAHYTVIKQGLHLLTMGLGADTASVDEILHKDKISRFVNLAKSSHNFIIYDVPFEDATNFLADLTYTCDNLVITMDASNWGIVKTMLNVCNISSEDMQDVVFKRAQIVINKLRNLHKVMGSKIRTGMDILKVMDKLVLDLIGDDPGFYFSEFKISGIVNDDPNVEDCWFEDVQYSDTKKGQAVFLELLYNIVMNK